MSSGIINLGSATPITAGLPSSVGFFGIVGAPRKSDPESKDSSWEILAPAKLNLYLEVLGLRPDGFHALETLMVPVRIYDQLIWQESKSSPEGSGTGCSLSLQVRNLLPKNQLPLDAKVGVSGGDSLDDSLLGDVGDNLVLRAAQLLADTAGIAPRGRFDLIKRIPIQAGMGGGSSDAAAALLLANAAWELNYTREQLLPLAAELGSDIPFFLGTGAAICRGRGELIEPVAGLPRLHFVAVKPPIGLSTAKVFRQLAATNETADELAQASPARLTELIAHLQKGDLSAASLLMTNRLETAAERIAPWLISLREIFSRVGCVGHFMTGSGSTYVGVMRTAQQAQSAVQQLRGMNLGYVFATSSC